MNMLSRWPSERASAPESLHASETIAPPKRERWSLRRCAALALVVCGGAYFVATASVTALLITGASIAVMLAGLIAVAIWAQNNVDWC